MTRDNAIKLGYIFDEENAVWNLQRADRQLNTWDAR